MKQFNKKSYLFLVGIVNILFWLLTFILRNKGIDETTITIIEGIELLAIGITLSFIFILVKDLFYAIPLLFFVPFIFSRSFDIQTMPLFLYIAIGLALLGLIIRLFRFKIKFRIGKMFFGLLAFGLSLILGGLNVEENEYRLTQFIVMLLIAIGLLLIYLFFSSQTNPIDFTIICFLMNMLAILLLTQEAAYYIINPEHLLIKKLHVGWGVSNNVGLMLLFTIPFSFYQALVTPKFKRYIYLSFVLVQYIGIIFSYSRGSIIIASFGLLVMIIVGFKYFKNHRLEYLGFCLFNLVLAIGICLYAFENVEGLKEALNTILIEGINFEKLNGRKAIYEDWLAKSMDYPILGHGVYYPFVYKIDVKAGYQWGHCTYLHALFTTGFVGVTLLTYHMVEKYYGLIKKMDLKKFTLLLGFLLSGLYGMIDISYFFINYMVVLVVVLILSENYMERLINFKVFRKYDN